NVASRSVPPVAARYNTPNRPLPSRNAFKPQQPHAPLPFGLTCRSAVKVFPSSVERATRTTRFASPSDPPVGRPCQTTKTFPLSSAATEPPPSRAVDAFIKLRSGSKPFLASFECV